MRIRAAASSIANGSPSRRTQISATAGAFSFVTSKPGFTARARSMKRATASYCDSCASDGRLAGIWQVERRDRVLLLTRDLERAAAAGQDGEVRAGRQQLVDRCAGPDHLLEVVEHDQHALGADVVDEALDRRATAAIRQHEGLRDRRGHQLRVADGCQLDEPHAVGVVAQSASGDLEAEARLPGAARPGEGQQAVIRQQSADGVDLRVAAEERRQAGRKVVRRRVEGADRGEVVQQPTDDELPEALRMLEVLEPVLAEVAQLDAVGEGVLHQRAGRVRQQHLPAVRDARDAAGPVDVEADIGLRRQAGLAGVQADADPHLGVLGPRLRRQRTLGVDRRRDRGRCRRERGEERVALGADLVATARREGGAQQLAMAFEDGGPSLSAGAEQARRPLDVAEEERDGAGQQLGHRSGVCGVGGHAARSVGIDRP